MDTNSSAIRCQQSTAGGPKMSEQRTMRLLDVVAGRAANMRALGTVFEANTRSAAAQQLITDYDTFESDELRVRLFFMPLALSVAETARSLAREVASHSGSLQLPSQAAKLMKQLHGTQTSDVVHFMSALARTSGGTRRLLTLRHDLRRILKQGNEAMRKLQQEASSAPPHAVSKQSSALDTSKETHKLLMHLDDHVKSVISGQILARLSPIGPHTPASVLAFLADAERVHPPAGSADIMRRVGGDAGVMRFCHGLFMPGMASRPLAFVLSALLPSVPHSIQQVLAGSERGTSAPCNTAVFYSITNCFPGGLQGLGLGSHLLLAALRALSTAHQDALQDVVTLSPIPTMAQALRSALKQQQLWAMPPSHAIGSLCDSLRRDLVGIQEGSCSTSGGHRPNACENPEQTDLEVFCADALALLTALDASGDDGGVLDRLGGGSRNLLLYWAARHVLFGRPLRSTSGLSRPSRLHRASDPVTNFHASNGASVARLNANANISQAGLQRAYGCMVNYRYNLLGKSDHSTAEMLQLLLSAPLPHGDEREKEDPPPTVHGGGASPQRRRQRPWWSAVAGVASRLFSAGGVASKAPAAAPLDTPHDALALSNTRNGLLSIASATGYRLIGQLAVTGFGVLVHACTPCLEGGGLVSWPPLFEGLRLSAVQDLRVQSCFARVLQGTEHCVVLSDPAVCAGKTVCLVAMGKCTTWLGGHPVAGLSPGDHCVLGDACDCVSLAASPSGAHAPVLSAGVLLVSMRALRAARAASGGLVCASGAGEEQVCGKL